MSSDTIILPKKATVAGTCTYALTKSITFTNHEEHFFSTFIDIYTNTTQAHSQLTGIF